MIRSEEIKRSSIEMTVGDGSSNTDSNKSKTTAKLAKKVLKKYTAIVEAKMNTFVNEKVFNIVE